MSAPPQGEAAVADAAVQPVAEVGEQAVGEQRVGAVRDAVRRCPWRTDESVLGKRVQRPLGPATDSVSIMQDAQIRHVCTDCHQALISEEIKRCLDF